MEGTVHVLEDVERDCRRAVDVSEGCWFQPGGAYRDGGRCSGIGRGHDWCCQEGGVYNGVEVDSQVPQSAASKVGAEGRHV